MSNYDQNTAGSRAVGTDVTPVDAGLRAYMLRIYGYMTAGVGLTALVACLTYQFTGPELLKNPIMWVFIFAPLVLVFFISARINTLSANAARWLFYVYAALVGVSLSTLFHIYTITPRSRASSSSQPRRSGRAQHLGIHQSARLVGIRHLPVHGPRRRHHRKPGQPLLGVDGT